MCEENSPTLNGHKVSVKYNKVKYFDTIRVQEYLEVLLLA